MHLKKSLVVLLPIIFFSCEKEAYIERNTWVKEVMEEVYLWEDYLPATIDPASTDNTFEFFESLRYVDDHWSWISDDYYATSDMLDGITTTAGHEFSLYYKNEGDYSNVKGIIEYVMQGSPAEAAGIKRGDTFTRINGQSLNIDNYIDLITSYTTYTIGFDSLLDGELVPSAEIEITEVAQFQENPIHIDSIYTIDGHKIGYMMYNSFLDEYNDAKSGVFEKFKSANITDLIIDLRYNNGGSALAEEHLANLIAPRSAEGEIFATDHWNSYMTDYFEDKYGNAFFYTYIKRASANINLQGKLIGLTSSSTASASEGLLNGLGPLVDLTLIGDTTHGKYTGMIVIPDDEDHPEWAIVPIVVRMTNKDNVSVKGGMAPKVLLNDNPLDGYQLGDIRETMLAKAIDEITGARTIRSTKIYDLRPSQAIIRIKNGKRLRPIPVIKDIDLSLSY